MHESKKSATTDANQALNTPREEIDDELWPITRSDRGKLWLSSKGHSSNTLLYATGSKESVTRVTTVLKKRITTQPKEVGISGDIG